MPFSYSVISFTVDLALQQLRRLPWLHHHSSRRDRYNVSKVQSRKSLAAGVVLLVRGIGKIGSGPNRELFKMREIYTTLPHQGRRDN